MRVENYHLCFWIIGKRYWVIVWSYHTRCNTRTLQRPNTTHPLFWLCQWRNRGNTHQSQQPKKQNRPGLQCLRPLWPLWLSLGLTQATTGHSIEKGWNKHHLHTSYFSPKWVVFFEPTFLNTVKTDTRIMERLPMAELFM